MSAKQFSLLVRTYGRSCPSPEQLMKCCRNTSPEAMTTFVNDALAAQFTIFPRYLHKPIKKFRTVIIDFHKDCYYGTEDNPYVKKSKTYRSTTLSYECITADLYCSKGIITVAFLIRLSGASVSKLAIKLMEPVENLLKPQIVLFDGIFATIKFLDFLSNKKIKFLGRKSKTPRV
ncbi:MAG: hypothetical protein BAJALOKI1v1_1380011 [Promethearchaeota archaeon]|nr:MAG: hypothetical protein BAJALOKI1v1_1380011 [Candidatus Lokiarchaeota archaeon]